MGNSNRVKYGLKNCHYAIVTESESEGVVTSSYGTVKAWPGAVSLSMDSSAERSVFRADDSDYFVNYGEGGYSGDLECALIPEDVRKSVLGVKSDDDGILVEDTASVNNTVYIAFLFEFNGDAHAVKHCFYKVSLSRPSIGSQTTGENGSIEPQTETVTLTAVPRADADKYIHAFTGPDTDSSVVSSWYTNVPVPTFTTPDPDPDPDPDPQAEEEHT